MSVTGMPTIQMKLNAWRGYSAYEIAVNYGFNGTEEEWLQSLKGTPGRDGSSVMVNDKSAVSGNITVRGTDILCRAGNALTVADAIDAKLDASDAATVENSLSSTDPVKALSAAQGKILRDIVAQKAQVVPRTALLLANAWTQQDETSDWMQTISVAGLSANAERTSALVTCAPVRAQRELYADCGVMACAQGDNVLTFAAQSRPDADIGVQVIVLVQEVIEP